MRILSAVVGPAIAIGIIVGPCAIGAQVTSCTPGPGQITCTLAPGTPIPQGSKPMRGYAIERGMPYSGVRVVQNVTIFPDGSRKEDGSSTKEWRDSEGRKRSDVTWESLDGSDVTVCQIDDPVALVRYIWKVGTTAKTVVTETHYNMDDGIVSEIWPDPVHEHRPEPGSGMAIVVLRPQGNPNRTNETLGPEYINGVYAEGSRSIEIIPPGKGGYGLDHPVKRIDEIWMSPDLKMVVKTFLDDGLGSTESIELKNIDRSEPDPSVFQPPPGLPKRQASESDPVWKERIGAN
jgi:hypothetical protein